METSEWMCLSVSIAVINTGTNVTWGGKGLIHLTDGSPSSRKSGQKLKAEIDSETIKE